MSYLTLKKIGTDEFTEKKSRFIGWAKPVTTEEQALAFLEEVHAKYPDANHGAYAYSLRQGQLRRYSDAGEPQGTAGVPILEVLTKPGIVDAVVVVTRYFGGILLGGGGLIRAYGHGASIAVANAGIATMVPCQTLELVFDYAMYGKISYLLPDYKVETLASDFGEQVTMTVKMRKERVEAFSKQLSELTAGALEPKLLREEFDDME